MAILGGSPLGIIGLESRSTRTGASTFPGAKNANFDVNKYNAGKSNGKDNNSIFYGGRTFKPFPATSVDEKDAAPDLKNYRISKMHSNSLYDTSILNILEKLSGTYAQLRATDFAYLKDVGVYPNNRLMIARRFSFPVGNNLFRKGGGPLATMISWVPPSSENFFSLSFGEKWTDAESDFTEILNSLGDDFSKKLKSNVFGGEGLGSALAGGLNAIPFPGITEQLQRLVLEKLGIFEEGSSNLPLPAGDPNLIRQAKRREVGGVTGFSTTFNISMTCEWEQKFLSGVDPTIVWLDIIALVLRFGTSNARFYGLGNKAGQKIIGYASNPVSLIEDVISAITEGITSFTKTISSAIEELSSALNSSPTDNGNAANKNEKATPGTETKKPLVDVKGIVNSIITTMTSMLKAVVGKYKEKIVGVVNALSGMPSGPWHITIGNPMRPTFCSGDLVMSSSGVKLDFGPNLAFNDLPSTIKVTFQLENARTMGLNEIMERFNTGYIRSVEYVPSVKEDAYKVDIDSKGIAFGNSASTIGNSPGAAVTPNVNNSTSNNSTVPATPVSNSYSNGNQSTTADNLYNDLNKGNPQITPGI
jgi:hypothetical protein